MPISSLDRDLAELACGATGWNPRRARGSRVHRRRLHARHAGERYDGLWTHDLARRSIRADQRGEREDDRARSRTRCRELVGSGNSQGIEDGDTTVTLTDATVFPPGSPRYEVPLLRIRLAQVAGWWLVPPTPKARRRSRPRPLVSSRLPPPPARKRTTRPTAPRRARGAACSREGTPRRPPGCGSVAAGLASAARQGGHRRVLLDLSGARSSCLTGPPGATACG